MRRAGIRSRGGDEDFCTLHLLDLLHGLLKLLLGPKSYAIRKRRGKKRKDEEMQKQD